MSRSQAGQGLMFVMVMDTGSWAVAWAGLQGRQRGEKGLVELGDKLAGDVCCTLSQASQLWVMPGLAVPVRKISRGNSWVPLPGRWHQWVHSLLEGMAGVANPLLELMTRSKKQWSGGKKA